ncbi:DNA polymerase III subunit beta [Acinetobacter baumannii]|uniref:DNA polymerase III subunit beta n=1 Tax=Acinetobacter baumannii TaxID=470 RepID=UPI0008DE01BF|nr:DNA polymerase III subunit beta [Acinetobacter baumannii]OIH12058.1 DNA polymerase III subunit beta [Acinetobacter baumannii]
MKLKINRDLLSEMLNTVISVIERKSPAVILSNVCIILTEESITLIGSDTEIEITATTPLLNNECVEKGEITLPARRLSDLLKALPSGKIVKLGLKDGKMRIECERSKYEIATLPTDGYPRFDDEIRNKTMFSISPLSLKSILDKTKHCMAVQDVRYYLTGLNIKLDGKILAAAATDGHRCSIVRTLVNVSEDSEKESFNIILPKKAVAETLRFLDTFNQDVNLSVDSATFRFDTIKKNKDDSEIKVSLIAKLIDGKFPEYERVVPKDNNNEVKINKEIFKDCLSRATLFSNERLKSVLLLFSENILKFTASNIENEQGLEIMDIEYNNKDIELSLNSDYIMTALSVIDSNEFILKIGDTNQIALIICDSEIDQSNFTQIVMPMRL